MPTVYEIKVKEYKKSPLQKKYKLQTYFTKKGLINYFIIVESLSQSSKSKLDSTRLVETKEELFIKLEKDYSDIKVNIKEQASIIYNIRDLRLEKVLQLYNITGFLYYNTTLKDEEIQSSYKLLLKKELNKSNKNSEDPSLV